MQKVLLSDVQSTFYKIVDANVELSEKRYIDLDLAKEVASKHKGKVFKVTKRITETLEMEKV